MRTIIKLLNWLCILSFMFCIVACGGSKYSATCKACHTTYSYEGHEYGGWNQRNVKCINYTNLCKSCYSSYCYSIGKIPNDY